MLVVAILLTACGGGSDTPRTSSVKVAGDSLSDAGTFGVKATVQSAPGTPTLIWTDSVASAVQAPPLCPRYRPNPGTGSLDLTADARCTSYAVLGAQINPAGSDRDATGYSIVQQLKDMGRAGFGPDDLLLVDGGGNDAALLMAAYISAFTPSGFSAYAGLLSERLTPAQLASLSLWPSPAHCSTPERCTWRPWPTCWSTRSTARPSPVVPVAWR